MTCTPGPSAFAPCTLCAKLCRACGGRGELAQEPRHTLTTAGAGFHIRFTGSSRGEGSPLGLSTCPGHTTPWWGENSAQVTGIQGPAWADRPPPARTACGRHPRDPRAPCRLTPRTPPDGPAQHHHPGTWDEMSCMRLGARPYPQGTLPAIGAPCTPRPPVSPQPPLCPQGPVWASSLIRAEQDRPG